MFICGESWVLWRVQSWVSCFCMSWLVVGLVMFSPLFVCFYDFEAFVAESDHEVVSLEDVDVVVGCLSEVACGVAVWDFVGVGRGFFFRLLRLEDHDIFRRFCVRIKMSRLHRCGLSWRGWLSYARPFLFKDWASEEIN